MRNYLSFGAGVNSVALYLLMVEQGIEFEAVFSDTGCEWPETYHYLAMFQWWIKANGLRSVTVLKPDVEGSHSLIEHCEKKEVIPSRMFNWCSEKFKRRQLKKYMEKPAFVHIGFALDEAHRAKITSQGSFENRYLLIENEITRNGCIERIVKAGLPIPRKSGCYICFNQSPNQWKELRKQHPELYCRARNLERKVCENRVLQGKSKIYFSKGPLAEVVGERQIVIFAEDEYPPCLCGL